MLQKYETFFLPNKINNELQNVKQKSNHTIRKYFAERTHNSFRMSLDPALGFENCF